MSIETCKACRVLHRALLLISAAMFADCCFSLLIGGKVTSPIAFLVVAIAAFMAAALIMPIEAELITENKEFQSARTIN